MVNVVGLGVWVKSRKDLWILTGRMGKKDVGGLAGC